MIVMILHHLLPPHTNGEQNISQLLHLIRFINNLMLRLYILMDILNNYKALLFHRKILNNLNIVRYTYLSKFKCIPE